MHIEANKNLLLFRYSNYRRTDFIGEHLQVIHKYGYTWLVKAGKRTSVEKIKKMMSDGGFVILKSPTKDGNKYYAAVCTEFLEDTPKEGEPFPLYYNDFLNDLYDVTTYQWFKVVDIYRIKEDQVDGMVLHQSNRKIVDVLGTTRTAVMFLNSTKDIQLDELTFD